MEELGTPEGQLWHLLDIDRYTNELSSLSSYLMMGVMAWLRLLSICFFSCLS
jgi:hypothetical protein